MGWLLFLFVVIFVGGIILLGAQSPLQKKTREQFLDDLTKFLEGTLEPIVDEHYKNSFRISFKFRDHDFVFEDLEGVGFKNKIYKCYLKIKMPSKFTLTLTEKKRSGRVTSDIFIASEVSSQYVSDTVPLQVPKFLKDMHVFTNDPFIANQFLNDAKVIHVLKGFKNADNRGYPFLSIGIVAGEIILEFYPERAFRPNFPELWTDISSIENYLNKMLTVVRVLKEAK